MLVGADVGAAPPEAVVEVRNPFGGVDGLALVALLRQRKCTEKYTFREELVGQPVKNIIPQGFAERLVAEALACADHPPAQQLVLLPAVGRRTRPAPQASA